MKIKIINWKLRKNLNFGKTALEKLDVMVSKLEKENPCLKADEVILIESYRKSSTQISMGLCKARFELRNSLRNKGPRLRVDRHILVQL